MSVPPEGEGERRSDQDLLFEMLVSLDTLQERYIHFTHRVLVGLAISLAAAGLALWQVNEESQNRSDTNRKYITDTCQDFEDLKRSLRDTVERLIPGEGGAGEAFALGQFAEASCPPADRLDE